MDLHVKLINPVIYTRNLFFIHLSDKYICKFFHLGFYVACKHYTFHITTGSFVGRGNQYIQFVKVLYCKLLTIGNELLTFPHNVRGLNLRPQRWEASVLPATSIISVITIYPVIIHNQKYQALMDLLITMKTIHLKCLPNIHEVLTKNPLQEVLCY